MCELLVRIVDKVHPDPYIDANHSTKRGDVIVVRDDGHVWGQAEISNPDWIIIKVLGVSANDASVFVARELDDDAKHPSRVLQARMFRFDLDAPVPTDLASLIAAQIRKPKLRDPFILG